MEENALRSKAVGVRQGYERGVMVGGTIPKRGLSV